MSSCRLSNSFIICMVMHHSRICIHTWGTLSFCFHLLPNKRSITDIQRNYDKQILSLFNLITHCLNFHQAVHPAVKAMNPLGLFSDYFDAFLHFLILQHPFWNGYVCHTYISLQFPRCSCLKFKHCLNVAPKFPFPFPKDLPTPCLFG